MDLKNATQFHLMFSEDIEIEVTYVQNTSVMCEMIGIQLTLLVHVCLLSISIISLQFTLIHRRGVFFSQGGAGCR